MAYLHTMAASLEKLIAKAATGRATTVANMAILEEMQQQHQQVSQATTGKQPGQAELLHNQAEKPTSNSWNEGYRLARCKAGNLDPQPPAKRVALDRDATGVNVGTTYCFSCQQLTASNAHIAQQ